MKKLFQHAIHTKLESEGYGDLCAETPEWQEVIKYQEGVNAEYEACQRAKGMLRKTAAINVVSNTNIQMTPSLHGVYKKVVLEGDGIYPAWFLREQAEESI